MSLTQPIMDAISTASAKALATNGPAGLNVVPVSMVNVTPDAIWLFDFFMEKTRTNLQTDTTVALTAWTDMTGVQVKATVDYSTSGDTFDAAVAWVKTQNPDRVVKGLLVLTPTEVFDISPGGAFSPSDLTL